MAGEPAASLQATGGRVMTGGGWHSVLTFDREQLTPGTFVDGPVLVLERHSSTVVPPGWRLRVDGAEALVLTRERHDHVA